MKRKDQHEDIKFIGINGFEEIEDLIRTAPKPDAAPVDRREKLRPKRKKLSLPAKKRAVPAIAAGVAAVMFTCVTVVNACGGAESSKANPTAQTSSAAKPVAGAPDTVYEPVSLLGMGDEEIEAPYYALYIEDELMGVVEDGEALQEALDTILLDARYGYDDLTTTEFANEVEVLPYYDEDETVTTVDELMEETEGMYSIKLETDWRYTEETDYETEVIYDDELPEGYEEVTQAGEPGKTWVVLRLTYIDGEEVDETVASRTVLSEPVTEKITVGTGDPDEVAPVDDDDSDDDDTDSFDTDDSDGYVTYGSGEASGAFMWPLPHTHNITSEMGWRWGRMHNGIDIAGGGDYGMPFVAADGGEVIWAGNDGGGYGNYVMIDHGNGYMTVYGHASELNCYAGQTVSQGDVIGFVGSTGNSTGPHLHFEIRYNGEYQDPLNYVC